MFCADWSRSRASLSSGNAPIWMTQPGRGLDAVEIAAVWIMAGSLVATGAGRAGATAAVGTAAGAVGTVAGLVGGAVVAGTDDDEAV